MKTRFYGISADPSRIVYQSHRSRSVYRYKIQSYLNFPSFVATTNLFPSFLDLVPYEILVSCKKQFSVDLSINAKQFVPKDESLANDLDNFDYLIPCIVNKIQFQATLFSCYVHESCNL